MERELDTNLHKLKHILLLNVFLFFLQFQYYRIISTLNIVEFLVKGEIFVIQQL